MPIYTKRGDKGESGLFRKVKGKSVRISKASCNTEALGDIDELNSYLGIVSSKLKAKNSKLKTIIQNSKIERMQNNLLQIGSIIAGSHLKLGSGETGKLEKEIDKMDKILPKLSNFILPGGSEIGAHLMYARALVRKAERSVVGLTQNSKIKSKNSILKYMNRLSDYLFVLARWENYKNKVKDIKWRGGTKH